ncbi:MAG TPA: protoporphyrinogen oxidase [Terriglobales bacterium]|nr:protoporphyrinogen oxidase [Terriglobales bacterium]
MKRIAIIGGGISGLSAAFTLEQTRRSSAPLEYVLFESSPRLGGVLVTEHVQGCLIEAGPDSFLTEKPWATDLCRQLGLADQLIGSNDADRKTYILVNGKLVVMPDGLMFMVPTKILPTVFSPLFSFGTKLRMAREWFHPPHKANGDESVAALVERHYGSEMVERLADPLLSGVYGGEAAHLSVRAVLPRFADMESKHGSLGRAMLASRKKMAQFAKGPSRPLFTSLKDGMQQMVDGMVAQLNGSCMVTNSPVHWVHPQHHGWTISDGHQSDHFDAIILAVPAHAAAGLLERAHPDLAGELRGIAYTSSITVNLGYEQSVRASLPLGFGFLVPRSEGKRMLACTFVHNKFPHRTPEERALLRCFLGGTRNEAALEWSDAEIIATVRKELGEILGLQSEPLFSRVCRWKGAMAQYGVGHLERLDRIEGLRSRVSGLFLAGNAYRGIGVPDCVRSGTDAATNALVSLGLLKPQPEAPLSPSISQLPA